MDADEEFARSRTARALRAIAVAMVILLIAAVVIDDLLDPRFEPNIPVLALLVGLLLALLNIAVGTDMLNAVLGRRGGKDP